MNYLRKYFRPRAAKAKLGAAFRRVLAGPSVELYAILSARRLIRAMRDLNGIQLSPGELCLVVDAVRAKAPCNFLVFGLGNDSKFWSRLNRGGNTVFVEDDREWFRKANAPGQKLKAYLVNYGTTRGQWRELLDSPPLLEMELPAEVRRVGWDVILVDGPAGWKEDSPGRMKSIYHSSRLAGSAADIFVHDCDRQIERIYCDRFLKRENLIAEVELLRHYRIFDGRD
jgi:glucuronoxylan 4-O-methyltransferase